MQYELQLNLQQIAALSAAISLWEKEEIKDKVKEFAKLCHTMEKEKVKNEWQKLMKTVLEESNKTVLPPTLENELVHFVVKIGEKICNWCLHVEIDNEFPFIDKLTNYFDKIVWTPYGTVDEVEIFKSYLSKNHNLNMINIYNIACSYALEEYINDLWQKLPTNMKKYSKRDMYKDNNQHILAYWKYCRDCDLSDLIKYFDATLSLRMDEDPEEYDFTYNLYFSPQENMFWVSVHKGYSNAVKYFWDKLTEEQRNRSIIDCTRMTIMCYNNYDIDDEDSKNHKKEKYVEICVFLLNQMNEDQRKSLFEEELKLGLEGDDAYEVWDVEVDVKGKILIMLLSVWPWQELFIPVLNDMLSYLQLNKITICKLLDAITRKILDEHYLEYPIGNSKYPSILQTFWSKIPQSMKQKIVHLGSSHFIDFLLIVDDLQSIEMIFNDPDIADVRDKYLEAGKIHYLRSIIHGHYEPLDQLMEKICRTGEEKRCFKQKITIWGQSEEGNEFLDDNPESNGPEEGQNHWRCLDDIGFCEFFVKQKQYDSVDKFLSWKFETEDERRKCKKHLKSDKFAVEQIYEIWNSLDKDVDKAKENSTLFLNWLLGSEEEVTQFKKEKIINCDQEKLFVDYFVKKDLIQVMNDFLSWCLSSEEEVQQVKQKIGNNMAQIICIRNISLGHVDKAERFVRWAFPEKESMESFVKGFIVSDDGITSCYSFLKINIAPKLRKPRDCIQYKLKTLSGFVNFWIRPLKNVKEFRIKFSSRKFKFNDAESKENYKIFMSRLEDLEQNIQ